MAEPEETVVAVPERSQSAQAQQAGQRLPGAGGRRRLAAIERFVSAAVFIPDRRTQKELRGGMVEISQRGLIAYNTPQSDASAAGIIESR
jgi:hypothetical protein